MRSGCWNRTGQNIPLDFWNSYSRLTATLFTVTGITILFFIIKCTFCCPNLLSISPCFLRKFGYWEQMWFRIHSLAHWLSVPTVYHTPYGRWSFSICPTDTPRVSTIWQALSKALKSHSVHTAYIPRGQTAPFGDTCLGEKESTIREG